MKETAYEQCLCHELANQGIEFKRQAQVPVVYKEEEIECGFRADLIVEEKVIIELKAVDKVIPIHQAQLLTYMKLAKLGTGLLINFNVSILKDGIKRMSL
jgi:GxxExxY protein